MLDNPDLPSGSDSESQESQETQDFSRCPRCNGELPANESAAYGGVCEQCFCKQRSHKKHYKNGEDKEFSPGRGRGRQLHVRKIM